MKPNPKNAKEPGVAMAHEAERVLRSVEVRLSQLLCVGVALRPPPPG